MRCKTVIERLDDHVDGLLPAPQAEAIRDHLDLCGECRDTALALKAASASLATWDDVEPPADCFDRILAEIDALPAEALERPTPRRPLPFVPRLHDFDANRFRRVATGGLAAAAAVLAALVVTRQETRSTRRTREPVPSGIQFDTASWPSNSRIDSGLLYEHAGRPTWQSAPRYDVLEVSPR